jgi:signal peptidase I
MASVSIERDEHPANPGQINGTSKADADGGDRDPFHSLARDWFKSILIGFVLFLVLRTFALEAFRIPSPSMEATLLPGDFVLVNKAIYGSRVPFTNTTLPAFSNPSRGDVIVFRPGHDADRDWVKRLIGLPGDTVEMSDKQLIVNGDSIAEPYAQYLDGPDASHPGSAWQCNYMVHEPGTECHPSRNTWGPLVIPDGQYLVLGDNRDDSDDSRYWGFVPRDAITGRPSFVYFSFARQSFESPAWRDRIRWGRIGRAVQ